MIVAPASIEGVARIRRDRLTPKIVAVPHDAMAGAVASLTGVRARWSRRPRGSGCRRLLRRRRR